LVVNPAAVEIRSREIINCLWEFHPDAVEEFRVEVVCNVYTLSDSSRTFLSTQMLPFIVGPGYVSTDPALIASLKAVQHYPLTVSTLVTECIINSKPQTIDFGFIRINSSATSTVTLTNHSDSQMHFMLLPGSAQKLLQLVPNDDVLPPKSSRDVEIRFTPKTPGPLKETILCSLVNEMVYQQAGHNMRASTWRLLDAINAELNILGCNSILLNANQEIL
jgi:hypothetical protein